MELDYEDGFPSLVAARRTELAVRNRAPAMPCVTLSGMDAAESSPAQNGANVGGGTGTSSMDAAGTPVLLSNEPGGLYLHPWENHVRASLSSHRRKNGPSPFPFNAVPI